MRPHPLALLLLLLAFLPTAARADDIIVKAALEPEVIGIGESAVFSIEVRRENSLGAPRFRPSFEMENLEIASGPRHDDDFRYENGKLSSSRRISWRLRPLATGKARVRSVSIVLRDRAISLRDREIAVQEEPTGLDAGDAALLDREEEAGDPFERLLGRIPPPWRPRKREPTVFLRASVEPARPFVGQQAVYTVHLYTSADVGSIQPRELPTFRGFWVRDIPQPSRLPTEMVDVGGARYGRVALFQKAIFPLRPGKCSLEPTEMDLLVRVLEPRFFGPPLSRHEPVRLRTAPVTLDVQPLPPAPAGFHGAVGRMSLSARLEPGELRMGEASTLTVTLSGQGNLQGVSEPPIAAPPGLTIYPPQQQGEERLAGTTLQGRQTWSYVVVPERAGRHELRVPEIPYFDPGSRQYRVAAAPPLEIRVLPRLSAVTPEGEPHPIRSAAVSPLRSLSWDGLLPWLFALPWGIALVVTLARRRQQPVPAGVAGAPGSPAPSAETCELRLREAAAETRPRQAAARIEEVWREHLAARWDIPPGTPSSRWRELLAARGADPATAQELVHLAGDLHYLRYAPQLSATGDMISEAVSRSRLLLKRLR